MRLLPKTFFILLLPPFRFRIPLASLLVVDQWPPRRKWYVAVATQLLRFLLLRTRVHALQSRGSSWCQMSRWKSDEERRYVVLVLIGKNGREEWPMASTEGKGNAKTAGATATASNPNTAKQTLFRHTLPKPNYPVVLKRYVVMTRHS
ncbi:hypothetical protein OF83DRAFT_1128121 [Amylostereum chailletii]|nr:hypothetical protein OF83DRAFT_1128121 [Amylostereum chailletii]